MTTISSVTDTNSSALDRMGMCIQKSVLSCGASHLHIPAPDNQSSLVLAVPISLTDNSGVAHVLEHLLLTSANERGTGSLFFRTRAASSAVDMNAVTNSRYLAVHFTCADPEEYMTLLDTFTRALFEPDWSDGQLQRETATIINEMSGAFSDRHFFWLLRSYQALFIEGSAQFNPGGDPDQIAGVSQEKLQAFWRHHFTPSNLIAISYGSVTGKRVQQRLDLSLSRFSIGCRHGILPSVSTETARDSAISGIDGQTNRFASAVLIAPHVSENLRLDVSLLQSFFQRYSDKLAELCNAEGIRFIVPPAVKEVDGDSVVFAICHPGSVLESQNLWREISGPCTKLIRSLSSAELGHLARSAFDRYFTLGNYKFGTGVAAAFELLDSIDSSESPEMGECKSVDVKTAIEEFSIASSWIALLEKTIHSNPKQVRLVCDDSLSCVTNRSAQPAIVKMEKCTVPEILEDRVDSESRVTASSVQQHNDPDSVRWHIPEVSRRGVTRIYHYRLPRPWISSAKLTVPLPVEWTDSKEWSQLKFVSVLLPRLTSASSSNSEAVINALKVPGHFGYRLYLSLSGFDDLRKLNAVLDSIDSLLLQKSLEEVLAATVEQRQTQKKVIPLHKLAIYRSASHVTDVAKAKLVLAGYALTGSADDSEWQLDTQSFSELSRQPRSLFFATAVDASECVTNDTDKTLDVGRIPGFINEYDGDSHVDLPVRESVSGELNYCARVWTLDTRFGSIANEDAVPHVFSSLLTNLFLEPVLRGERHAYAASADIDHDLGVLAMFSFRDPNLEQTDAVFTEAFEKVVAGNYDVTSFEQAKRRAISRLHIKGSYDQRCEQQFDRLTQGFDPDYFAALEQAIKNTGLSDFSDRLSGYFKNTRSGGYALVGSDSGTRE